MQDINTLITNKIIDLKAKHKAVILVHNYQLGEVQDIGDFVGDSLELSQQAAKTTAEIIVFCGVHFMAETASILCPDKKILLPDLNAGCPMANMVNAQQLIARKKELPGYVVVTYINSTAEVKSESDICCTSANAERVVKSLTNKNILFIPDQYLGAYTSLKTGIKMEYWPGYCPTHARIRPEDILRAKKDHPQAIVFAHPECRPETSALADYVLSTGGMLRQVRSTKVKEIIVATEVGIIHRLKKENPDKMFIAASEQAVCPRMKLITLEKILESLESLSPVVKVPESIRVRAKKAVDRMLEIG